MSTVSCQIFLFSWWRSQCRLKATSSYHFSSSSLDSSDVYSQLPGRRRSLSFFLTYFLSFYLSRFYFYFNNYLFWSFTVVPFKIDLKSFPYTKYPNFCTYYLFGFSTSFFKITFVTCSRSWTLNFVHSR